MKRAVRTVIRILAAGLIVIGGLNLLLEYYIHHRKHSEEVRWGSVLLSATGIIAGVAFFAMSSRIARRLAEDFEE